MGLVWAAEHRQELRLPQEAEGAQSVLQVATTKTGLVQDPDNRAEQPDGPVEGEEAPRVV